jgi:tricorn protease
VRENLLLAAMAFAVATMITTAPAYAGDPPLLLQHPSLSADRVAFDYAGEIWTVARSGGSAIRLVTGQGKLSRPIFSPDGGQIAFTGNYDGNTDVYVVDTAGGQPRRLTWHPGADTAVGWTPDGKSVLFSSPREVARDLDRLYTVPASGGIPRLVPLPSGEAASFSHDGQRLAYVPHPQWQPAWKNYRGGQTTPIWLADLATSHVTVIPRATNSNDKQPMWVGDTVYFLSDRDGPVTLYGYDVTKGAVSRKIDNSGGFDMAFASAGPRGIVIDGFGKLEVYDFATGKLSVVPVSVTGDFAALRPHFVDVKPKVIASARLTPSGKRVILEARGEVLSAPVEKGDVRNLTQSPGVADRWPEPSPDGRSVAYFSDESGEYALHIRATDGLGPVRKIALGAVPSFFYDPRWSPDSKKIIFSDKRLNLWLLDLAVGRPVKIDSDRYDSPAHVFSPAWSGDSRWVAYTKQLTNHLHAAFVYNIETGRPAQITDGLSDVASPRFDRNGKYLYFAASTSTGRGAGWLDMSSLGRAVDGAAYVMVLRKDTASPIPPLSDEESASAEPKPGPVTAHKHKAEKPPEPASTGQTDQKATPGAPPPLVRIDFDHIDQRILALPIPRANIVGLEAGLEGVVYTLTAPNAATDTDMLEQEGGAPLTLSRFDLESRENKKLADKVKPGSFALSGDASKMLLVQGEKMIVADASKPVEEGKGVVALDAMQVWVDPKAEWKQMYAEAWRIERDFLYDPKIHGLDIARARKLYARYLPGIAARQDLNTLFEEMTGHIQVGHTFIGGGEMPEEKDAKIGLLGADYDAADGYWRIARILRGENWNPKLVAPLSQPGVNVQEGEYLLAVNGQPVVGDQPVYRAFMGTAGKQTLLTVGPNPNGNGSRTVTVVPVGSETQLRLRSWMEANRRKVDEMSGGRLAYVYLPDTAAGGFANFNRYYYSQVGKQGAILDERFNHGGDIADYIIDEMKRTPQMINETREGEPTLEPASAIFGPKVMIINEMSGSGGDAMPWMFKKNNIGPLVGHRTWGGLVGIGGYPELIDGGTITAPRWAIFGTKGQWEVENIGIAPDVPVEQDPELIRQGHDPQLEAAVRVALDLLAKTPAQKFLAPSAPDKHSVLPQQ